MDEVNDKIKYEEPLFEGTYIKVNGDNNWIRVSYYDNMDYYVPAMKFKRFVEKNGVIKDYMMRHI